MGLGIPPLRININYAWVEPSEIHKLVRRLAVIWKLFSLARARAWLRLRERGCRSQAEVRRARTYYY